MEVIQIHLFSSQCHLMHLQIAKLCLFVFIYFSINLNYVSKHQWPCHFTPLAISKLHLFCFQNTRLQYIFLFVIRLLKEVVESFKAGDANSASPVMPHGPEKILLQKLLVLSENTLTWSFISLHLPKRLMSVFEQDQNPSLRPGQRWTDVFNDPALLPLFFKLFWHVRGDWDLGHHALNCLVQLSSLNGVVLLTTNSRSKYLTNYLTCLFSFLSR